MKPEIPHPPFIEKMIRFHAQMEQACYSGEITCASIGGDRYHCPVGKKCPFKLWVSGKVNDCALNKMREILGDHVKQHDTENPK